VSELSQVYYLNVSHLLLWWSEDATEYRTVQLHIDSPSAIMAPKQKTKDGLVQQKITSTYSPERSSSPEPARTIQGMSHVVSRFARKMDLAKAQSEALKALNDRNFYELKADNRSLQEKVKQKEQEAESLEIDREKLPDTHDLLGAGNAEGVFNILSNTLSENAEQYIQEVKSRCDRVTGSYHALKSQKQKLEDRITELTEQMNAERATHENRENRYFEEIASLKKDKDDAFQKHEELQNDSIKQLRGAQTLIEKFKNDDDRWRNSWENATRELSGEKEKSANWETKFESLKSEYESEMLDKELRITNLTENIQDLTREHKREVTTHKSETDTLNVQLVLKQQEIEDHVAKVAEAEKKWKKWSVNETNKAKEQHTRDRDALQSALNEEIDKVRNLEAQAIIEKSKYDVELSQWKLDLEALKKEVDSKANQLRVLESEKSVLHEQYENLQTEFLTLEGKHDETTTEASQKLKELAYRYTQAVAEITRLKNDVSEKQSSIDELEGNIRDLDRKTEMLETEKAQLSAQITELEEEAREKIKYLKNEIAKSNQLQAGLTNAEEQKDTLSADLEKVNAELHNQKQKFDLDHQTITSEHNAAIEKLMSEHSVELANLNQNHNLEVTSLNQKVETAQNDLREATSRHIGELKRLEQEQKSKEEASSLDKESLEAQLATTREDASKEAQKAEQTLDELRSHFRGEKRSLESELNDKIDALRRLEPRYDGLVQEKAYLQQQVEKARENEQVAQEAKDQLERDVLQERFNASEITEAVRR
jgi:chromosome segregation ATPase